MTSRRELLAFAATLALLLTVFFSASLLGGKVLYFAGYRRGEDLFKRHDIEQWTDQVIWCTDTGGTIRPFVGETAIFITPGYRFRAADGMMTNFHLPKSTLFMLVSAFAGLATMRAAYAHAIADGYRFYSYGDASLLWRAA